MRIIAALTDAVSIRCYLQGVGLPADPPTIAPPRPPPSTSSTSPPDRTYPLSAPPGLIAVPPGALTASCVHSLILQRTFSTTERRAPKADDHPFGPL